MAMEKMAALSRAALFAGLAESDLRALAATALEQRLNRGEMLFIAGEAARGLYVIVEGAVRAYRVGPDGREQVIHVERAGATVGEVPFFDEGPYPSNVAAEEDTVLLFIQKGDVHRILLSQPRIALSALKVLAGRLRNCASLVETLSLHDVDRRLARLLLSEGRARGTASGRGLAFDFQLTHQQVASRIGSVREVVSRAYSRLQQAGLVRVDGRRVLIPDTDAFSEYVDRE